jgi:hypothetical protein
MISINEETKTYFEFFYKYERDLFALFNFSIGWHNFLEKDYSDSTKEIIKQQCRFNSNNAEGSLIRTEQQMLKIYFDRIKTTFKKSFELQYFYDRYEYRMIFRNNLMKAITETSSNSENIVEYMTAFKDSIKDLDIHKFSDSLGIKEILSNVKDIIDIHKSNFKKELSSEDQRINDFILEYKQFLDNYMLDILMSITEDDDILNRLKLNYNIRIFSKHEINPFIMFITFINLDQLTKSEIVENGYYDLFWIAFCELLEFGKYSNENLSNIKEFIELKNYLSRPKEKNVTNSFNFDGAKWIIRFNGKSFEVNNYKGMITINLLLHNPNKTIEYIKLYVAKDEYTTIKDIHVNRLLQDEVFLTKLFKDEDRLMMYKLYRDKKQIEQKLEKERYEDNNNHTNNDIENLPSHGLSPRSELLKEDLDEINETINTILKSSFKSQNLEKIRLSVTNNYRNALKKIELVNKDFADYLNDSIDNYKGMYYKSTKDMIWL